MLVLMLEQLVSFVPRERQTTVKVEKKELNCTTLHLTIKNEALKNEVLLNIDYIYEHEFPWSVSLD